MAPRASASLASGTHIDTHRALRGRDRSSRLALKPSVTYAPEVPTSTELDTRSAARPFPKLFNKKDTNGSDRKRSNTSSNGQRARPAKPSRPTSLLHTTKSAAGLHSKNRHPKQPKAEPTKPSKQASLGHAMKSTEEILQEQPGNDIEPSVQETPQGTPSRSSRHSRASTLVSPYNSVASSRTMAGDGLPSTIPEEEDCESSDSTLSEIDDTELMAMEKAAYFKKVVQNRDEQRSLPGEVDESARDGASSRTNRRPQSNFAALPATHETEAHYETYRSFNRAEVANLSEKTDISSLPDAAQTSEQVSCSAAMLHPTLPAATVPDGIANIQPETRRSGRKRKEPIRCAMIGTPEDEDFINPTRCSAAVPQDDGESVLHSSNRQRVSAIAPVAATIAEAQGGLTSTRIVRLRISDKAVLSKLLTAAPKKRTAKTSRITSTTTKSRSRQSVPSTSALPSITLEMIGLGNDMPATPPYVSASVKEAATAALPTPPSSQSGEKESSLLATIEPEILKLSKALTYRKPLGSKPPPSGKPEVWADSRQALCEAVPYFKKPQGGCHQNDKHVYAFLFDGVGRCREYMDSDVIIARAGGGMESDSTGMVQGKDHLMSEAQVQSVLNDIKLQNPLIVICGDKNTGAQCKMPHKYCVLGWYKPTMVWAEKTAGKGKRSWTTVKYRLERLASSKPWHVANDPPKSNTAAARQLRRETCPDCHQTHPRVYLDCWVCLNPSCGSFWLENGREAPSGRLEYDPAFLLHRTPWANEEQPYSVVPPLPDVGKTIGDNLTYINTRGVVCPDCGRCNSRYMFKGWRCDNPKCSWPGLWPQHQPIVPAALHSPWDSSGYGPALARNKHDASVKVSVRYTHGYKVYAYTFEGIEGSFVHAVANSRVREEAKGPNEMLAELQTADMGLERRRFGGEKMSGTKQDKPPAMPQRCGLAPPQLQRTPMEELSELTLAIVDNAAEPEAPALKHEVEDGDFMTAFSMNYGMPYKFVASGASRSFDHYTTPWPVPECRSRLNWAAGEFLADQVANPASPQVDSESKTEFNEELIFAYMEGQKIEYHDDGEEGLGPRIATLSLGGKAKMHLRMKAKHYVGCSKTGIFTAERPILGSMLCDKRQQIWEELQPLKATDISTYQRRIKEIPKELGLFDKRNKKADDLVTVTFSHGDIILMDGYDIQQYLEHKVVPEGYLRFALTCRTVLEHHLKKHERPEYMVQPDTIRYDGNALR